MPEIDTFYRHKLYYIMPRYRGSESVDELVKDFQEDFSIVLSPLYLELIDKYYGFVSSASVRDNGGF